MTYDKNAIYSLLRFLFEHSVTIENVGEFEYTVSADDTMPGGNTPTTFRTWNDAADWIVSQALGQNRAVA